jgi:predicted TIM-barrel enzyme
LPKELVDFLTVVLKGVTLAACGRRPFGLACAGPVASVNPIRIALCHGGPTAEPEDAQHILEHSTREARLFGASGMERPPTEAAITENMRRFKRIARASTTAS